MSSAPPASASPEPTPAHTTPAASVRKGFFPMPSRAAAEVDWSAVGPGWFLLEWQGAHDLLVAAGDAGGDVPRASDGLTLIGPDGAAYALQSLADADASKAVWWLGPDVALFRETTPGGDETLGDVVTLDLATGATELALTNVPEPQWGYLVDRDHVIGASQSGEILALPDVHERGGPCATVPRRGHQRDGALPRRLGVRVLRLGRRR